MAKSPNKWIVALTVMLPVLMVILDTSIVNVSLDHIRGSLSAGIDESTWAITSYLAANAVVIPMTGWLSRLFGRKRLMIVSIILFTVSSFICGSAWSIQSLIAARIFQGLAGGALQPISQAILLETFPPYMHGTAMAIFGIGIMFGPAVGPLVGGWITDNWSWRWSFYINIPIGIIGVLMAAVSIFDPSYIKKIRMKIDYWGFLTLAVGIGCLQIVLDKGQREDWFSSEFILWFAVVSVLALILFLVVELFTDQPVVDLRIFRSASFGLGNGILFFANVTLFGSIVLPPIYLQTLMGYTATLAGTVLGPGGFASLLTMPLVGRLLATQMNPKILIALGIMGTAASAWLMSRFNLQTDFATVLWPRIFFGASMVFIIIPLTTLTLSAIPKEEMGNATSIFNLVRNLGGSFGVSIVTTLLSSRSQFHQARLVEHLTPFDPALRITAQQTAQALQQRGLETGAAAQGSLGLIYGKLIREATMISFNEIFFLLATMTLLTLPAVLFMKRIRHSRTDPH